MYGVQFVCGIPKTQATQSHNDVIGGEKTIRRTRELADYVRKKVKSGRYSTRRHVPASIEDVESGKFIEHTLGT